MNNTTRLNRLKHFVTILKIVPKLKFKMSAWMAEDVLDTPCPEKLPKNFIEIKCTTVCCALGWAALDKKFNRAGLTVRSDTHLHRCYGNVYFKEYEETEAGQKFFGITSTEADKLFLEESYKKDSDDIKPRHVITKIQKLIKKYENDHSKSS